MSRELAHKLANLVTALHGARELRRPGDASDDVVLAGTERDLVAFVLEHEGTILDALRRAEPPPEHRRD